MTQENPDSPGWQLAIGQPFVEGVDSWPDGRFEYRVFGGGHHLLQLCYGRITERDLHNFQYGQVHLGLAKLQQTLFLLFRIEGFLDWSDQAYNIRLVEHAEDRELPTHPPGTHQVLSLVLVEAETGLVRAMRVVTWSKHASAVLDRLLREQLEDPAWSPEGHARRVHEVYAKCPSSKDLVKAALLTEKAGSNL